MVLHADDFLGLALYPRVLVSPALRSVKIYFDGTDDELESQWGNVAVVLKPYAAELVEFQMEDVTAADLDCEPEPKYFLPQPESKSFLSVPSGTWQHSILMLSWA
jgi:hypothetical protein